MRDENLDERKLIILKAIIDDYINSMEPVGSRTVAKKYDMGLSSATIRNEMADLEEMGYLSQPHASAGRIPSDKGYRVYVDHMLALNQKDAAELDRLKNYLEERIREWHDMIKVASGVLSKLTQYAAVSMVSSVDRLSVKAVQLVPVEQGRALVVVVMSNDAIQNKLVTIDRSVDPETVLRMSSIVNEQFAGITAEEARDFSINDLMILMGSENLRVLPLIDGILDCIAQCGSTEIYRDGDANLLSHPEFCDVTKAKNLLEVLHRDDFLKEVFSHEGSESGITIRIGSENAHEEVSDCAVVSATYSINDTCIGTIGVLGPKRMNYAKVISALEYIRKRLNRHADSLPDGSDQKKKE